MIRIKYILALSLLLSVSLKSIAQELPFKWKEISKEEIDLKEYNGAPAVVTYSYGQMFFDTNPNGENLYLFMTKHVRIKILNEEGLKHSKVKFTYHDMNCERYQGENSYIFKGFTHNVNDIGEIKSTKLKSKYISHKDSSNCQVIAEAEFQNVKVGSIIEYKISTPTLKFINPDSWEFQSEIPVIYSEFRARVPRYFKYNFLLKNINDLYEQDSSFYDKVLNYKFKYRNNLYSQVLDLSGKEYRFVNQYMPPVSEMKKAERIKIHLKEARTDPGNYAWKRLTHALSITTWEDYERRSPNQRKMLTYPPGYFIYYIPSWRELNEGLLKSEKFGIATIKFWDCDELVDSLTKGIKNDIEKAELIYYFVKENMVWNGSYNIYADVSDNFFKRLYAKTGAKVNLNNVGEFFEEGEGSSSEINFVLMHLLNKAKIEVHPVLLNTKKNVPVDKDIPVIKQFVTVAAYVITEDKTFLLDAAEKDSKFMEISNKYDIDQMFIVRKDEFGWLNSNE